MQSPISVLNSLSVVPVGERSISISGKDRYRIYLPMSLNSIWSVLHGSKVEVFIYIKGELGGMLEGARAVPLKVRIIGAGERYFIHLPTPLNMLWDEVNRRKIKVEVLIRRP